MSLRIVKIFFAVFFLFLFVLMLPNVLGASSAKKSKTKKTQEKDVQSKASLTPLMELSKDRAEMTDELERDTRNYKNLKAAIEKNSLKEGESVLTIKREYGEPVLILSEDSGRVSRWLYKIGNASFFSQEKIYLIFDEEGKLVKWKIPSGE